ncbi:MAG: ATP-binding protein [Candidatus Paceibacterota bacterium]
MAHFRAKARAVDLLGKGQIADLPTAITELWKNGYDAYAKNLTCKLFLSTYKDNENPLFVISDDGFGMSEDEILNMWFVLGTDSKARGEQIKPHFGLDKRIPMGEKGIGRLSVSYLGSQMLMLTKKKNETPSAFFMDWRVLDNYDFFLEDLNIPLFTFDQLASFKNGYHKALKDFEENLNPKLWDEQPAYRKSISKDLSELIFPKFIDNEIITNFTEPDFHGTTFIIFTPHDQLLELTNIDILANKEDSSLKYLRASLSGLHNDLKHPKRDFSTEFLIFNEAGKYDIIKDFFTKDEMLDADHWCKGKFDENGFFDGELRVFGQIFKHTFKPNRPPGKTPYGPFEIEWGSVEGEPKNTTLTEEQYRAINEKLRVLGGLYVYRDNFRVLPYGRPDVDFLEFEERRSRGAGYYFFSHRRFIGYIDISRETNSSLRDKAGREGFIQNKAYRQFRDDLIEFFIDISVRYMRKTPKDNEDSLRQTQLKEINAKYERQSAAEKKKNKRTKKAFLNRLRENKESIQRLKIEIRELEEDLKNEVRELEINYNAYNSLLNTYEEKKNELRNLRIQKPRGVRVTKKQEKDYLDYQNEYRLVDENLSSCEDEIEKTRNRVNLENLKLEFQDKFTSHLKYLDKLFSEYISISKNSFERVKSSLNEERDLQADTFKQRSESLRILNDDEKQEVSAKINGLITLTEEQIKEIEHSIGGFIKHVENLQIDVDDDFLRGWYQEQNEKLEDRLRDYEELAQVGMTIEIIDHQFNVMYAQMNDAINELDKYTRKNPDVEFNFKQLKSAFQHLEGNFKLLRPLYRTSRRTRELIIGFQIENYIKEFFKNDFKRYEIDFSVDNAFREFEFFTFDSIIKPIFLNIVNNANYWLIPADDRKIRIEYIDKEIRIMNSGERIDDTHLTDIFTLFFTRKRDGRGIGLYLAKKNLNSIGYDIYATNDKEKNKLDGACFVIRELDKN